MMYIRVVDMVGEHAITAEDGEVIYDQIHPPLCEGRDIELDFADVSVFASPFFNAAIGRLLEDISAEDLRAHLHLKNLSDDGLSVLRRVIENAKEFYKDPQRRRAIETALEQAASTQEQ